MLTTLRRAEYAELIGLFALMGAAMGMWTVPLSGVLGSHGLGHIRPYAYAASGLAAFVSPLLFGAMADRHASPVKVLRWLSFVTAVVMAAAATAIQLGASPWVVLALIQLHALCFAPTSSIAVTIVLARLADAKKEFGPVRAMMTLGWMLGCLVVSLASADQSTLACYGGAMMWLILSGFTHWLPVLETPPAAAGLTWTQRFGLDALTLLRNRDTRAVYLTTALFTIPLAAFYPYTPVHLHERGLDHTSAWMSLGQVTELVAMFSLGLLLHRWRLKWLIAAGLGFGVLRFALCALDLPSTLIAGVTLHGCSYTLVIITVQVYLDQRVDPAWRARAQALMTLFSSGVGNMIGYLATGAWFAASTHDAHTRWPLFWGVVSAAMGAVLIFFVATYRGRGVSPQNVAKAAA